MNRSAWIAASLVALAGCATNVDDGEEGRWDDGDEAAGEAVRLLAGDVVAFHAETPHPYTAGWRQAITSPGATFVRVHFTGFSLAKGDYVTVSSPDGSQSFRYEGRGPNDDGEVWAFAVDGDTAVVELHSSTGGGRGFAIGDIGRGTIALGPEPLGPDGAHPLGEPLAASFVGGTEEVVCATEGREDVACHSGLDAFDALQRPVARLLFASGGSMFLCTGWLIAGANDSTLITNNHCISTQREASTLEARFNYQVTTCGGSTMATPSSFAGDVLLKTNDRNLSWSSGGLDYTLMTLKDNPEATWGELVATRATALVGDNIDFIQHPGGRPKKVGYWKDAAHDLRCKVDAVNQTYWLTAFGSQIGYSCDSEGGSSGSPIINDATGKVTALHHLANVSFTTCRNGGTKMSEICRDSGRLLACED